MNIVETIFKAVRRRYNVNVDRHDHSRGAIRDMFTRLGVELTRSFNSTPNQQQLENWVRSIETLPGLEHTCAQDNVHAAIMCMNEKEYLESTWKQ